MTEFHKVRLLQKFGYKKIKIQFTIIFVYAENSSCREGFFTIHKSLLQLYEIVCRY